MATNEFKNAYDWELTIFGTEQGKVWAKIREDAERGLYTVYVKLEAYCPVTDGSFGLKTTAAHVLPTREDAERLAAKLNAEDEEWLGVEPSGAGYFVFGPEELKEERKPKAPEPCVVGDLDGDDDGIPF